MIISSNDINEARKLVLKGLKENLRPIWVRAVNPEFNRKMLEFGKFDALLMPEKRERKESLKQIDSGFNHVLAKIALKNRVRIVYDLEELRKLADKKKAIELSSLKQNIKILKKARTELELINYNDSLDARCFLLSLKASTNQAKKATTF